MPENHELVFAKCVLKVRLQKLQTEVAALQTVLSLLGDLQDQAREAATEPKVMWLRVTNADKGAGLAYRDIDGRENCLCYAPHPDDIRIEEP